VSEALTVSVCCLFPHDVIIIKEKSAVKEKNNFLMINLVSINGSSGVKIKIILSG
jgi:hypothetical protein